MVPPEPRCVFEAAQDPSLLEGLCLVTLSSSSSSETETLVAPQGKAEPANGADRPHRAPKISDRMCCSACSRPFDSREEQTEHYRLDWHRFNLKQRLLGRRTLTAEEFEEKSRAGDVSSISGSDSSSSESDSESDLPPPSVGADPGNCQQRPLLAQRSHRILFRNSQGQLLSAYRCILSADKGGAEEPMELVASLRSLGPETCWIILMAGGGHFAGAIFRGNEVLEHKTFHRYTVRARRGTTQGLWDAQGSMPKSAGSSLRRYNEAALLKEIQELLASWAGHLQGAERIFLRAPRANRGLLLSGRNSPLRRDDPRLRSIPFITQRATFREVQRVHGALGSLLVYGKDVALADLAGSPRKAWKKATCREETPAQGSASPAFSEEEEAAGSPAGELEAVQVTLSTLELREFEVSPKRNHKRRRKRERAERGAGGTKEPESLPSRAEDVAEPQEQMGVESVAPGEGGAGLMMQDLLFTACKTGDVGVLQRLLGAGEGEQRDPPTPEAQALLNAPLDESGWTLLHVAAASGRGAVVRLLLEVGADPALRDQQEQPPYCVSADRPTRNEFRRYMGEQPDRYDYAGAQVPGPLTAEMAARQLERRRAQKAQRKQREKEEREEKQQQAQEQEEKRHFAALSEREKRALAAEKRLAAQLLDSGGTLTNTRRCWLCGETLLGRIPFHYLDFSFCSTRCLQAHRRGRAALP